MPQECQNKCFIDNNPANPEEKFPHSLFLSVRSVRGCCQKLKVEDNIQSNTHLVFALGHAHFHRGENYSKGTHDVKNSSYKLIE